MARDFDYIDEFAPMHDLRKYLSKYEPIVHQVIANGSNVKIRVKSSVILNGKFDRIQFKSTKASLFNFFLILNKPAERFRFILTR